MSLYTPQIQYFTTLKHKKCFNYFILNMGHFIREGPRGKWRVSPMVIHFQVW